VLATYHQWMAGQAGLPQRHLAPETGMRAKAYAYLLGVIAILAGLAVMAFGPTRPIAIVGGALLLTGLGAAAWATEGRRALKWYTEALLLAALIGGVIVVVKLTFGR
jgi:hypothetical protein